jgi:hypothetical protein
MVMGILAGRMLTVGSFNVKKWDVHPVSAIMCESGMGGPIGILALAAHAVCVLFAIIGLSIILSAVTPIGSPRHHVCLVALGFPRDGRMTRLFPSIILSIVASSLWPSAFRVHDALVCALLNPTPWVQQ